MKFLPELSNRYGAFISKSPGVAFSDSDVPDSLKILSPYARFWGVSDDIVRERLVAQAPAEILTELKSLITQYEDELDFWLAGPEATSDTPSQAYIAFSALRMASDFI